MEYHQNISYPNISHLEIHVFSLFNYDRDAGPVIGVSPLRRALDFRSGTGWRDVSGQGGGGSGGEGVGGGAGKGGGGMEPLKTLKIRPKS